MSLLKSILLGILQGIAEFLPISSSGHLAFMQRLMGLSEVPVLYDIFLHLATLLVILIYFRKLIIRLIVVLFRFLTFKRRAEDKEDLHLILATLLATGVTFAGYLILKLILKDRLETMKQNMFVVFSLFIFTGIMLIVQSFFRFEKRGPIQIKQGILVGLGQILGLFPGISRSGATISFAVFSKLDRKRAGELSFLISIPAIVGALIFDLDDAIAVFQNGGEGALSISVLLVGMGAAFVSGMVVFPLLLKMLQRGKLWLFSLYLIPLGVGGLIYFGLFN